MNQRRSAGDTSSNDECEASAPVRTDTQPISKWPLVLALGVLLTVWVFYAFAAFVWHCEQGCPAETGWQSRAYSWQWTALLFIAAGGAVVTGLALVLTALNRLAARYSIGLGIAVFGLWLVARFVNY